MISILSFRQSTLLFISFFFNDTATTEIYTLSLHDALPIWGSALRKSPKASNVVKNPTRSITRMYLNTLQSFRHEVYACLQRAGDALFEVADALLTDPSAQSLAELSLAPSFQRRWPSLYAAFADGRIDQQALSEIFARYLPLPADGERIWLGIDASSIQRPESKTARDRSVVYVPNLPQSSKPITYGWQFSAVVLFPPPANSCPHFLHPPPLPHHQHPTA